MATPDSEGNVQSAVDRPSAGLPAMTGLANTARFREPATLPDHPLVQACGAAAVCPQDSIPDAALQRPRE